MPGPTEITPTQLMRLIGTPAAPVILNVCIPEDVAADPHVIPTSQRIAHMDVTSLVPALTGRAVVVACLKGLKLSHGAAALLRTYGIKAEVLAGGTQAWAAEGLMRTPISALPSTQLWVTRARPKIDRIACPWLIRRFVDPGARFMFVPTAQVSDVADRFDAIPFDMPDVPFSHIGDTCTFDTMLSVFGLQSAALARMALVIRGADINDHTLAPQAAGLLAVSVGLSRMYTDDLDQLQAGIAVYDALYRWARDGVDEGHDWPAGAAK